jgi:hypothetical protein
MKTRNYCLTTLITKEEKECNEVKELLNYALYDSKLQLFQEQIYKTIHHL